MGCSCTDGNNEIRPGSSWTHRAFRACLIPLASGIMVTDEPLAYPVWVRSPAHDTGLPTARPFDSFLGSVGGSQTLVETLLGASTGPDSRRPLSGGHRPGAIQCTSGHILEKRAPQFLRNVPETARTMGLVPSCSEHANVICWAGSE